MGGVLGATSLYGTIMKFYFDESGSFAVKNPGPHLLVGIQYPEVFENNLSGFYKEFVGLLNPSEFVNGEPKGQVLSDDSRNKLFSYLNDNSWLRIALSLTDSEFNGVLQIQKYREEQIKIYENQILDTAFQSKLVELHNVKDDMQIRKGLSDVQVIKGLLLMDNLFALFINAFNYFTEEVYDDNWTNFDLNFDRQDKTNISRMERWVNREFISLITAHNEKNPVELHSDWYSRNHPILLKYRDGNEDRLLLDEMFSNGFNFLSSEDTFQLQITDWISNTLFKVFKKELSIDFLDKITSNLVGHKLSRIQLMYFKGSDDIAIVNKYKEFLLTPANPRLSLTASSQ